MRLFGLIAGVILLPLLLVLARPYLGQDSLSDPYRDVSWQELANGATMQDQPARIRGFMLPVTPSHQTVTEFFLTPSPVRDLQGPLPPREQMLWVVMESGEVTVTDEPITVWGVWESGSLTKETVEAGHQVHGHGWEVFRATMPGEGN